MWRGRLVACRFVVCGKKALGAFGRLRMRMLAFFVQDTVRRITTDLGRQRWALRGMRIEV